MLVETFALIFYRYGCIGFCSLPYRGSTKYMGSGYGRSRWELSNKENPKMVIPIIPITLT